jgi:S1-C subfamily serine protease
MSKSRSAILATSALAALLLAQVSDCRAEESSRSEAKAELKKIAAQASWMSRAFNLIHEVAAPSVVSVHTSETIRVYNPFDWTAPQEKEVLGEGSGFIFHSDDKASYIVTNSHVILQTNEQQRFIRRNDQPVIYDKISVVTNDNLKFPVEVVGFDVRTDLAVLKIPAPNLPAIEWGDSDHAHVGDWVIALGFPFGVGYSATSGIISATDRSTGIYGARGYESFIQTDAAINPGNSGGPLVNLAGEVIGVNANIIARGGANVGIGFAIPAMLAKRVAEDLLDDGKVDRPAIGIIPDGENQGTSGLRVAQVIPGGPADLGGITKDDVILKINGVKIQSSLQFRSRIASARVGEKLDVLITRNGQEQSLTVMTMSLEELEAQLENKSLELPDYGLRVATDDKTGIVIIEVAPGMPADVIGLSPGDRILTEKSFGPIQNLKDMQQIQKQRTVILQILKDGKSLWISLRK